MTIAKTIKTAAATTLLTALAVALPVSAASARPIAGGDAAGGITRGTIVRPPGPLVKPIGVPRLLTGFEVGVDSVVATATIHYTGNPGTVTVRWGDNTSSTRNLNSVISVVGQPQDPPGTVVLQHVYDAGPTGAAFTEIVTGQVGADSDSRVITVTPRYRVTQYQAYFTPIDHCDSFAEQWSEWRIRQVVASGSYPSTTLADRTWRQDRLTNPYNTGIIGDPREFRVLAGSQISVDSTMADGHAYSAFTITELDPIYDDPAGTRSIDLHPSQGTRHVDLVFNDDDSCKAEITADVNVDLLKPGLRSTGLGGVVGALA